MTFSADLSNLILVLLPREWSWEQKASFKDRIVDFIIDHINKMIKEANELDQVIDRKDALINRLTETLTLATNELRVLDSECSIYMSDSGDFTNVDQLALQSAINLLNELKETK